MLKPATLPCTGRRMPGRPPAISRKADPSRREATATSCDVIGGGCAIRGKVVGRQARYFKAESGRSGGGQRILQQQQVAPGEPLLQRLAQKVGRVESRHRLDLAASGIEVAPLAAEFEDALPVAHQL